MICGYEWGWSKKIKNWMKGAKSHSRYELNVHLVINLRYGPSANTWPYDKIEKNGLSFGDTH